MKQYVAFSFAALLLASPLALQQLGNDGPKADAITHINRTESAASASDVVAAANAFLATLSTSQQASAVLPYTAANATKWSNLPVSIAPRVGLQFADMTNAQINAARGLLKVALGSTANEGYDEVEQQRAADSILATAQGGGGPGGGLSYGAKVYYIAFLGSPSTTGTWELHYGGHHMAVNLTYKDNEVASATPSFRGIEPKTFTVNGVTYAPLGDEHDNMAAMLASLTSAQLTQAHLSQTFSDIVMGPGADGQFPATKVGVACSTLTATQKQAVLDAIKPWVLDADDGTAADIMARYESELDETYIAYSGNVALTTHADYVRIDGRSVWIEFICQNGIVYQNQIHYHTIWRDHARDYAGDFGFVTAAKGSQPGVNFSVYPSPAAAGTAIKVSVAENPTVATYTLRAMTGQVVATQVFEGRQTTIPTSGIAPGTYLLAVQVAGKSPVLRKVVIN